jgi:hypothetical protein
MAAKRRLTPWMLGVGGVSVLAGQPREGRHAGSTPDAVSRVAREVLA